MPRACSWSVAITRPPAFGCSRRTSARRVVRRAQHGRQPLAFERERGAQALPGARGVERVVEGRRVDRAVGRRPLHLAVRRREVDRADDAAVARARRRSRTRSRGPPRRRGRRRTGSRGCRSGTACPTRASRRRGAARTPRGSRRPRRGRRRRGAARRRRRTRRARVGRATPALVATCWYEVTMPCMSRGSPPVGRATTTGRGAARTPPPPAPTGSSGGPSARRRRAGRGRPPAGGARPSGRTSSCRRRASRRRGSRAPATRRTGRGRPSARAGGGRCGSSGRRTLAIGPVGAPRGLCRARGYSRATAPVASRPPRQTERKGCTSMRKRITLLLLSVAVLAATAAVSQSAARPAASAGRARILHARRAQPRHRRAADDRHRQPGLPAVVRGRLEELLEDQRPVRPARATSPPSPTRSPGSSASRSRAVKWTYIPFNKAFAPGPKSFDFDINQISITPARAKVVSFSVSYYDVNQAIVVKKGTKIAGIRSIKGLKPFKLGAQLGTTSYAFIASTIKPSQKPGGVPVERRRGAGAEEQADRRPRRRPADRVLRHGRAGAGQQDPRPVREPGQGDRPLRRRVSRRATRSTACVNKAISVAARGRHAQAAPAAVASEGDRRADLEVGPALAPARRIALRRRRPPERRHRAR